MIYNYQFNNNILNSLEQTQIKQKQIDEYIIRSSTNTISKEDFSKILKLNKIDIDKIEKDIELLNGKLDSYNQVKIISVAQNGTNIPSTKQVPKSDNDKEDKKDDEYLKNKQVLDLYENFGKVKLPLASVGFSAWKNNPWDYTIPGRTYKLDTIIAKTEKDDTVVYNKFGVEIDNKYYELNINESKTVQVFPESKFRFSPKLFLVEDIGYNNKINLSTSLYFSFMQYGSTINYPKFTFANLGIGIDRDKNLRIGLAPVLYRINYNLIKNLYLGPSIGVNSSKQIDISFGIGLSF